ncbi:GNAT family N-acetyltransferase [Phenylobacterium sp. LjRoot219]|uniref:GNAT family N-acetyltransferase n=1 Tax=Phenylobacterium sp. LjRoot219 TaxID=3342283 RepID=UPI003ECFE754
MAISVPEVLTAEHDLTSFNCGKPALNAWLKTRALANQRNGFTVVVVIHDAHRVVGYYGLSPTAVESAVLPRRIRTGQPPNPIPCLLLGQLAMDLAYAGRGVGTALVGHALERAVLGARLTGGRALLVRAIDEDAIGFWRRRGFLSSPADPYLLLRSLPDIEASLRAAGRL